MIDIFPFKFIKCIENNKIIDITYNFNWYFITSYFRNIYHFSEKKQLYHIHVKKFDKYFILNTTIYDLITTEIKENSEIINIPRSLFINYNIQVNNSILTLNEKLMYKKYAHNCSLLNIFQFNNINLKQIIILKNNLEFIKYDDNFDNIYINDIYQYL